jgi:hypothetical protein
MDVRKAKKIMAGVPQIKRLVAEDFPDFPGIEKLLQPLNTFMTEMSDAINAQLTFGQNILSDIRNLEIAMPSAGSAFPVKTSTLLKVKPIGVLVIKVVEQGFDTPTLTSAVYANWTYAENVITINDIFGLDTTSGKIYDVTILIIGG